MAIAAPVITFLSKAEAEGQCHLDRSGPFYQESRSSSRATREFGKAGNRIVRKDSDQS